MFVIYGCVLYTLVAMLCVLGRCVVSLYSCNDKQCVSHWQDYDAMIELVEALPDHDQILKAPVQYQYAFALNRRNFPGYRDKALSILEEVSRLECVN